MRASPGTSSSQRRAFGAGVYRVMGREAGLEYFTGYLIEKALSVDNIFVFVLIFGAFRVPARYQHRVLFWGILGALLMRGAMIFAVDSIPAIFAVTQDPFIVYSSNVFAILGLRALYFLVADVVERFRYLKVGLSVVLVFVGIKMLAVDVYEVPIAASLAFIVLVLGVAVAVSWYWPPSTHQAKARNSGRGEAFRRAESDGIL